MCVQDLCSVMKLAILQSLQASITWKECAQLPATLKRGKAIVINDKVYCGAGYKWTSGASGDNESHLYTVYCYDPSQDKWTTLPPLPVKYFGLGQVNGKLVAVGGTNKSYRLGTNEIHTYDERSQKWKQTIPPMPTGRWSPGVLSIESALVVAGGHVSSYRPEVEIFKISTSQWYRADRLATACCNISLQAIGNTCYALGGYNASLLNQTLYASVDNLLHSAVPANQTIYRRGSIIQSTWKTLPNTPTCEAAGAVLNGTLLAIGGEESHQESSGVYVYSPSTNSWIYISDIPTALSGTTAAVLSSAELLVIGGWTGGREHGHTVNTVFKGTLHLKL